MLGVVAWNNPETRYRLDLRLLHLLLFDHNCSFCHIFFFFLPCCLFFFFYRFIQIWADSCWKMDTDWTRSQTTRIWTSFLPKPWAPPSAAAPPTGRPAACSKLSRSASPLSRMRLSLGALQQEVKLPLLRQAQFCIMELPAVLPHRGGMFPSSCGDVTNLIRVLFAQQTSRDILSFGTFLFWGEGWF